MQTEPYTAFVAANDDLADPPRLRARFAADGYLYLSRVLDESLVGQVRREMLDVLRHQAAVGAGEAPEWTGRPVEQINDAPLYGTPSYQRLVESPEALALLEAVYGKPVFFFKGTNIRYSLPGDAVHVTPAHQDHFFIPETSDFVTVWIPLMPIPAEVGGLAVAPGSHHGGLRPHVEHAFAESYILKGRRQKGIPQEEVPRPWATTEYQMGDVLIMQSHMIHWALPNTSRQIRLSLDSRCQPAENPRIWQARHSMLELRAYRAQVLALADAAGLTREATEQVILEMMRRGLPAEANAVQATAAQLVSATS